MCLLGHCLALVYGDPEIPSPQEIASPELAAFPSLEQSHFLHSGHSYGQIVKNGTMTGP